MDVSDLNERVSAALEARDPEYRDRITFGDAYQMIQAALRAPAKAVVRELDHFRFAQQGHEPDYRSMSFRHDIWLRPEHAPEVAFKTTFIGRVTGSDIVILREEGSEEVELARVPFTSNPDLSALQEQLTQFYREGVFRQAAST